MAEKKKPNLGLVLSAGGARAAYQVGVMKHLADTCPDYRPTIFTGISAGSINAAFLAQGGAPDETVNNLYRLWQQLTFDQVFQTNFKSFARMGLRWVYDMFLSKVTKRLLLRSLLDAAPLSRTLLTHLNFRQIGHEIKAGRVRGLAISATNYHNGTTTIFFDSTDAVSPWTRERRYSTRCLIRPRHIIASCSIPILFQPVPIGQYLYGDGSLRLSFPFSPAIHLGATHLLAVGIRSETPVNPFDGYRPDHLSLGFVAGSVLNSIFLDSLEPDYENLLRINQIVGPESNRHVNVELIRPSVDLGSIAKDFLHEVPFHFRQILRATAAPAELGDLLSYLMFSPGYINAIMELGQKDAAAHHDRLAKFLENSWDASAAKTA